MKTLFLVAVCTGVLALTSCSSTSSYTLIKTQYLKMKEPVPVVGITQSNQKILMGGLSGLRLKKATNEELLFESITDRGPNGYFRSNNERPFLLPEFSPQIPTLKVNFNDNTFEVVSVLKLKNPKGAPLSGLPNSRKEENPIDIYGYMNSLDPNGIDSEALTSDDEGGFWVGEEYAPSLVHFNSTGVMTRRLTPFNELPKMYAERKSNRGFEGIAKDKNKLFGFLQSPLPMDKNFARIVEVDLETLKTSGEYFYGFEPNMDKLGDAAIIGHNQFLVIEQNGKKGEESRKYVYKITFNGIDKLVKKELLVDLGLTPFKLIEKVEGLAVIDSHRIALVNDNDFQISAQTQTTTGITPFNNDPNEMIILEFKEDFTK